jgi:hypothetical protein
MILQLYLCSVHNIKHCIPVHNKQRPYLDIYSYKKCTSFHAEGYVEIGVGTIYVS